MPLYETVLIARNDVTQQQVEQIADDIATELTTEGGEIKKREYWGLRGLAYRIKKNRKAHYMLLGMDAQPAFITEMERKLGLNEDVLRYMTIRIEAIDEAPSADFVRFYGARPMKEERAVLASTANLALVVSGVPTSGENTNISGASGASASTPGGQHSCISHAPSPAPPTYERSTVSSMGLTLLSPVVRLITSARPK